MKRNERSNPQSLLYSYYTLTHAITPRRNSPTLQKKAFKKSDAESGDETDRSVDNEITESFFMDEINKNTESCSLNSSRENLLDGDGVKDLRPNSRPNSRPSSGRRASLKSSELPVDARIKVLEEGLKDADMEREVVLSCLGKEYLERITMQNCLQEICAKSGYNYEEVLANIEAQSGARNMIENMIQSRAKSLLVNKDENNESTMKPQVTSRDNEIMDVKGSKEIDIESVSKEKQKDIELDKETEQRLKEVVAKFSQADNEKVNTKLNENSGEESSHTRETNDGGISSQIPIGAAMNSTAGPTKGDKNNDERSANRSFVPPNQSERRTLEIMSLLHKRKQGDPEKNSENDKDLKIDEMSTEAQEQRRDCEAVELESKQINGELYNMPEKSDSTVLNSQPSLLQSLDFKALGTSEKSLDSIDEGILMIKTFLSDLLQENQKSTVQVTGYNVTDENKHILTNGAHINSQANSNDYVDTVTPKRKHSLIETRTVKPESDFKPQRRRSYAEGMNMHQGRTEQSKSVQSRLFKPTVASKNKVKDKVPRKEAESDTEVSKRSISKPARVKRSASDVQYGPQRHLYNYTSTEDDSSADGDEVGTAHKTGDPNTFHYVYQMNPELTNREYSKLMSILNMLQEQKRKWEDEAHNLQNKIDELSRVKLDLTHDNSVLRKSLEAANRAIKEINSKVQELKLTIVPLRDENSKLREQNHSMKAKLDLLRKDKAFLLQDIQELKHAKQRHEDKLQIITDLYQNGRINLASDENNNTSDAGGDFSTGELQALLNVSNEEPNNQPVKRRLTRNRDNSKRHSFHGFERIDELAGNAEELLAEKEKVEEENEGLKKEVKELKKMLSANKESASESEAEILSRRRGWRMQREESKHRIIREILKTESKQVFGRPYSSCSDLTMEEDPDYSSRIELLDSKAKSKLRRPQWKLNAKKGDDQTDGLQKAREEPAESSGGISFEINFSEKSNTSAEVSWKEESEKIAKRLSNIKFEKPAVKETQRNLATVRPQRESPREVKQGNDADKMTVNDRENVTTKMDGDSRGETFPFEIVTAGSERSTTSADRMNHNRTRSERSSKSGSERSTPSRENVCKDNVLSHDASLVQHGSEEKQSVIRDAREERNRSRKIPSRENASWSTAAVFNQEASWEERQTFVTDTKERGHGSSEAPNRDSVSKNAAAAINHKATTRERQASARCTSEQGVHYKMNGEVPNGDDNSSPSAQWPVVREKIQAIYEQPVQMLEQSLYEKSQRNTSKIHRETEIVDSREETVETWHMGLERDKRTQNPNQILSRRDQDDNEATRKSRERGGRPKYGGSYGNEEQRRGMNRRDSFERESEDLDMNEYNWQRKTSAEELLSYEDYRRKIRQKELENAYSNSILPQDKEEGRAQRDEMIKQRTTSNHSSKHMQENKSQRTTVISNTSSERAHGMQNGVNTDEFRDKRDNSPWVKVPVYLKDTEKRDSENGKFERKTPTGSFQRIENGYLPGEERKIYQEGPKVVEDTLTMVESAFAASKASSHTSSLTKKSKSKSHRQDGNFIRRSPGTVMYLDELADSDSDSSYEIPKTVPRKRSRSLRRPRPKSDMFAETSIMADQSQGFVKEAGLQRNRSLRLPRRAKDDMFAVDISFESELQDDSFISTNSKSFNSSSQHQGPCQHHQNHYTQSSPVDAHARHRIQSDSGTDTSRSSFRRARSPGGFSCEMCREMSKKKSAQEKYCWEKYFPIGETTIETRIIKEDYV